MDSFLKQYYVTLHTIGPVFVGSGKQLDKKEYIKESTYANYSNNIFNHIIPKLGNIYIQDLNHKTIQDFLLNLFKNGRKDGTGGLSEKTIKDITIIIKGSLRKLPLIIASIITIVIIYKTYAKNYYK